MGPGLSDPQGVGRYGHTQLRTEPGAGWKVEQTLGTYNHKQTEGKPQLGDGRKLHQHNKAKTKHNNKKQLTESLKKWWQFRGGCEKNCLKK